MSGTKRKKKRLVFLLLSLVPALLPALGLARAWVLLPLLTLPLAARLLNRLAIGRGRELNPVLEGTAKLMVLHGVLFAVGIAVGRALVGS